jgi:hypothetical protein
VTLEQGQPSPLGEKLTDATCRASIPGQEEGESLAEVWSEGFQAKPRDGTTVFLPYTQMAKATSVNFRIQIACPTGTIFLTSLGAKHDAFYQRLTDSWGDALARHLLMGEDRVIYEARGACVNARGDGSQSLGTCRARIQPTALVILPAEELPVRVPFARVSSVQAQSFRVDIKTSDKGVFQLFRMGVPYQYFVDKLIEARRDYESESFQTLLGISPGMSFDRLQVLSGLMAEGRAVSKEEVLNCASDFWPTLQRLVEESPLADSYSYLESLSTEDLTSIGFKRTPRGNYFWFMMVLSGSVEKGGNSVALEVTSETGHATYLFRILERSRFPGSTSEQLRAAAKEALRATNDAMITTGFRREPIYLDDDRLNTPAYSKYLYASENLPELKFLRERFYARIIHSTAENWTSDLKEALLFNVTSADDRAKWEKSQTDPDRFPD